MKNDKVSFERLRSVLLDRGFVETAIAGPYLLFQHSPSETVLVYREYQPGEGVSWHDLVTTRRQLDERGLLEASEFETLLHKTPV
jgi:hypothetical protein